MRILLSIILLFLICPAMLFPSSFFTSSNEGIGVRQYITTVRGMGTGGTGLALPSAMSLNAYNIATWRYTKYTKINISMRYDRTEMEFGSNTNNSSTGNFSGLQLAIPIVKNKWVFGISLAPYTLVDFKFRRDFESEAGQYQETTFFEGNLARSQVNLVWAPSQDFSIGASFNYFFGTIEDRYRLQFNNEQLLNSNFEIEYQFQGPGAGLSAQLRVVDSLYVGGFFDVKPSLNFFRTQDSPITFEREEIKNKSTLPVFWGIGSSYKFKQQWFVSADFAYQHWSNGFNIDGIDLEELEDWYHVGFGIEHVHSKKRNISFLNKFDIRTGLSFGNIGYKFNNSTVMEYRAHLGLGLPFFQEKGRFDIALIGGIRGDKSENLAQEKFLRILFSVSASELWFQTFR